MADVTKANNWRKDLGVAAASSKSFFASKADLQAPNVDSSQSYVLGRAFDLLRLDGVLCAEKIPLVYFKEVKRIAIGEVSELHRKFWNHGGAPILVLVDPDQVHIYSGLIRPTPHLDSLADPPALVKTLDRASRTIREFLPSVESGEFFRRHAKSFNPVHRVDRDLLNNLQATRDKLMAMHLGKRYAEILDALLCRLVFVCYLFDRNVIGKSYLQSIGLENASHLRDVLSLQPKSNAKTHLYGLFRKLGKDFNGDLFSDDLDAEERRVAVSYMTPFDDFFRATNVESGQTSFWPYDFSAIPVEAISAIYERFLKSPEKLDGAFYTPRFLAELVLDLALGNTTSLLSLRCLDPACGSGIFLVGLFNRMAEEWKQSNPEVRNDLRARELRKVLCRLCGVDINPTACRITAFSLYLAYLDQLTPRDIQELQRNGLKLPALVHYPGTTVETKAEGNIWCGDFFSEDNRYPIDVDLVIGNPPWGSTAASDTTAAKWCADPTHFRPIPDRQLSAAFVWKAPNHLVETGKVCLVLPHGTIFNHSAKALEFQRLLFERHAVDLVVNLVDYQFFLFEEARHPAIVLIYRKAAPKTRRHVIQYWAPKTDWLVTRAEIISMNPEDRSTMTTGDVLDDLQGEDAPQIWKRKYWATPRDRRLVDRLSQFPRLRDQVRQMREKRTDKPWLIAEGYQPVGKGDNPEKAAQIRLPSRNFISATSSKLDMFLLEEDCQRLSATTVTVRNRSNKSTEVFRAPHVLISQGFTSIAYADFDVSFRHSLRGITGGPEDRELLMFLAAYLRSSVAKYFLFQTSSNWGVSRQKIHVEELLRLPFLLPQVTSDPRRSQRIVHQAAKIIKSAMQTSTGHFTDRDGIIRTATTSIEALIDEYFDILPIERVLIDDTINVIIPSTRPSRARQKIPTIYPSTKSQQHRYLKRVCETLNGWSRGARFIVNGYTLASETLGVGVTVLRKSQAGDLTQPESDDVDLLSALESLLDLTTQKLNTIQLMRGAKMFSGDHLYVVKPIGQRFWTETAALNDADEIAGTILMGIPQGVA